MSVVLPVEKVLDDDVLLAQIKELELSIEADLEQRSKVGDVLEELEVENQKLRFSLMASKKSILEHGPQINSAVGVHTPGSLLSDGSDFGDNVADLSSSKGNGKFSNPIVLSGKNRKSRVTEDQLCELIDGCYTMACANSVTRATLIKLLEQRRQLALELGHLSRDEKLSLDSLIAAAKDKPFDHDINRGIENSFEDSSDPSKAANALEAIQLSLLESANPKPSTVENSPFPNVPVFEVPPFVALNPELAKIHSSFHTKLTKTEIPTISASVGVGVSISVAAATTATPPNLADIYNAPLADIPPSSSRSAVDFVVNTLRANHLAYIDAKAREEKEAVVEESGADVDAIYNYGFSISQQRFSAQHGRYMPYEFDEADSEDNIVLINADKVLPASSSASTPASSISAAETSSNIADPNIHHKNTGTDLTTLVSSSNLSAAAQVNERTIGAKPVVEQIKCATLTKLVERLTNHEIQDLTIRYVFLLTYRSFTTPAELLTRLTNRYYVPLPPNLTPAELDLFKKNKLAPIQIKVCSVLKNWLEEHYTADFASLEENDEAAQLTQQLKNLIAAMLKDSAGPWSSKSARALSASLKKKESIHAASRLRRNQRRASVASGSVSTSVASSSPAAGVRAPWTALELEPADLSICPKPLLPLNVTYNQFVFIDCEELEIARQLTLLDFAHFRQIQPRECLGQAWSKKDKEKLAPHICAMIEQFNCVTSWVQQEILAVENLSKRAAVLKKFIKVGEQCFNLNNFNALFAIYCGLNANPIHRLKKTWEQLGAKTQQRWEDISTLFKVDKNSHNIRQALAHAITPCIPHLGIFLADLTFIEDGNPNTLRDMINFLKRRMIAERIRWIQQYQQISYQLRPVPVIQEYLQLKLKIVDEDSLWKLSTVVEPRAS